MTRSLNLKVYRGAGHALDTPSRPYQAAFTILAVPLAFALGYTAFRTRHLRPLISAFAVIGLARSAARALGARRRADGDDRLDETVRQTFPASDAPAMQP
jgi:hypothetical protein